MIRQFFVYLVVMKERCGHIRGGGGCKSGSVNGFHLHKKLHGCVSQKGWWDYVTLGQNEDKLFPGMHQIIWTCILVTVNQTDVSGCLPQTKDSSLDSTNPSLGCFLYCYCLGELMQRKLVCLVLSCV